MPDQLLGLCRRQGMVAGEGRQVPGERRCVQEGCEGGGWIGQGERFELPPPLGRAPPTGRTAQIDKTTAGDRTSGGYIPQHKAIRKRGGDGPIEHQLDVALLAGFDGRLAQGNDAGADFGRRVMQPRGEPLADGLGLAAQDAQPGVDAVGRGVQLGIEHHVAPTHGLL
ncbi:MAG TPA: hypothetical protein VHS75_11955 [Phenylobacterium sp.]|nr:hypothetical protein [Phenylobacterium sp.]HEX3365763.1 hypothetical protein [Phenylobacterium sp.]